MTISPARRAAIETASTTTQASPPTAIPKAAGPSSAATVDPQGALVAQLLKIESDARRATTVRELDYLMANETART